MRSLPGVNPGPAGVVRGPRPAAAGWLVGGWVFLLASLGCSAGGKRVAPPDFSPEDAAKQAMATYDKNGDGALDAKELEQCPPLKSALKSFDKNGDGRISTAELIERFNFYKESEVGLNGISLQVMLDNQPLEGAQVTFVPEKFLGSGIKPATGVSDAQGVVDLSTEGEDVPGVHCGLFRVEVSKKGPGGKELLPARYNTRTVLGCEVAPGRRGAGEYEFRLTSR